MIINQKALEERELNPSLLTLRECLYFLEAGSEE
jgi:hypothetical protein